MPAKNNIELRDPRSLRLHKLRRHFPEIDKKSTEWTSFTDSIHATGFTQNLVITAEGFVVTNYSAWALEAARDWQVQAVPVTIIPDELAGIVLAESAVCQTEHMTRGAAVYLMIPILQDVIQSAEYRRLENLKSGRKTSETELKPQQFSKSSYLTSTGTIVGLCARWGLSKETFFKAQNVWLWLNESNARELGDLHETMGKAAPVAAALKQLQSDLREAFEPDLLNGEKNLWNVESGIKGRLSGGEHELPHKQLELFGDVLDTFATRAQRFGDDRQQTGKEVRKWLKRLQEAGELAKAAVVQQGCEVTAATIKEFLKHQKADDRRQEVVA